MEDLKMIIAQNIIKLRRSASLTQAEFAEKLNYSDKAVSKWERGESVPDIATLKSIADLFGVTVDYLLEAEHIEKEDMAVTARRDIARNHVIITLLSFTLVWLVATVVFFALSNFPTITEHWLVYVVACPISTIVLLVFNCIWGKRKFTFLIISLLLWSLLTAIFIIGFGHISWTLFLIGVPAQVIIILWSRIKGRKKPIKQ